MDRLRAIVLDFDGVIANTEPLHFETFRQTLEDRGVTLAWREYCDLYLGFDDRDVFRAVARDRALGWDETVVIALVRAKAARYRELVGRMPVVVPGVEARLRTWAARLPLAIASGALRDEIETILRIAGLSTLIPVIVAAGETTRGKPFPDPYRRALELLDLSADDAARAVAIEDSAWGVESARAAGMHVVAVATSYPAEHLRGADLVVGAFEDLSLDSLEAVVHRERP